MLYGYTRCSTFDQAEGTTLREQERAIRGVAMIRGVEPGDVLFFSDPGVTGSMPLSKRPSGKDLIASLRKGDMLVVSKLDRLFRSVGDAVNVVDELTERGIGLIIADMGTQPVTESAASKMFFQMLSAFAEFERARINERTQEGRRSKKKSGGCVGTVPFGYRKKGVGRLALLEPDPQEIKVLDAVSSACHGFAAWSSANHDRKDAGDQIAYVARHLAKLGLDRDRAGHVFRRTQVRRLIARHYEQHFAREAA